ncbi:hypothetical protein DSL64_13730 [Dyadobacter luteus]|uniref:Uncharacterized protein n=1 Tax=Dyadobacter luteus TaxID=2259619 RepID=A0A3D8YAW8_9BACT|nr:hypothetical protein DSL64_13730 [Dyadobacter luteus]
MNFRQAWVKTFKAEKNKLYQMLDRGLLLLAVLATRVQVKVRSNLAAIGTICTMWNPLGNWEITWFEEIVLL